MSTEHMAFQRELVRGLFDAKKQGADDIVDCMNRVLDSYIRTDRSVTPQSVKVILTVALLQYHQEQDRKAREA